MIYSVRAAKALLFLACLVVFTAAGRQSSAADSRGPVFSPSVDLALNQRVERCVADLAELESYAANGSSDGDLSEVLDLISEKKRCLLHHSRRAQAKKRKNSRKKRKKKASKKKKADNYPNNILIDGASCSLTDGSAAHIEQEEQQVIIRIVWPNNGGSVCTLTRNGRKLLGSYINSYGHRGVLDLHIRKKAISGKWRAMTTIGSGSLMLYNCSFQLMQNN